MYIKVKTDQECIALTLSSLFDLCFKSPGNFELQNIGGNCQNETLSNSFVGLKGIAVNRE